MRDTPQAVMLFAAGFGTRMGDLTKTRPKPLVEVAGKPLIDHALALIEEAKVERVVVNVHYLAEQMQAHLAGRDVVISDERAQLLETGGGLRKALGLLGEGPVMTLNTDAVWRGGNVITQLRAHWDGTKMDALLALVRPKDALGHFGEGDFSMDFQGRLTRGQGYVYSGAEILNPAGIGSVSQDIFSLNVLWDDMLARGRVYGVLYEGGWCDVGRPSSITLAESLLHGAG